MEGVIIMARSGDSKFNHFVYTMSGATSVEDAKSFLIGILECEYGILAGEEAQWKGFKQTFLSISSKDSIINKELYMDHYINDRCNKMSLASPVEFFWCGFDKKGFSKYMFWGTISYLKEN